MTAPVVESTATDPATSAEAEKLAVKQPTAAELAFQKAKALLEPLAREGKTLEVMLVKLIGEGFTAKKAFKMIQSVLEDMGVRMSRKDRYALVKDILLKNDFAPKDWSEIRDICVYLASELDATDEAQALVAVRRYAKEHKIELPKRQRGEGGPRSGGNSFRARKHKWMVENATATSETFNAWLEGEGKKQVQINTFVREFEVAKEMAAVINTQATA